MTDVSRLHALVSRGVAAKRALDVVEPYIAQSRAGLIEAWAREPDEARRHEAWHAVRAHDVILKTIRDEIETGEGAQAELRFLAQQEQNNG